MGDENVTATEQPLPRIRQAQACLAAWLLPGAGHFMLGRLGRGLVALACIGTLFVGGLMLRGRLFAPTEGELLSRPAAFACLGVGPAYFFVRRSDRLAYGQGDARAASHEAGTTFLLAAGLLNMMIILDVFDIASGRKS